jgi:hypothetical protein
MFKQFNIYKKYFERVIENFFHLQPVNNLLSQFDSKLGKIIALSSMIIIFSSVDKLYILQVGEAQTQVCGQIQLVMCEGYL